MSLMYLIFLAPRAKDTLGTCVTVDGEEIESVDSEIIRIRSR